MMKTLNILLFSNIIKNSSSQGKSDGNEKIYLDQTKFTKIWPFS